MKQLTIIEEFILLAVYQLKDDAYLISIRDYLRENAGIDLAMGSVFAPLDRLRREGLLNTINGEPSQKVGGRAIKYYKITKQGLKALENRKEVHDQMWQGIKMNQIRSAE
ncbi:MAG: PadR family transcriptional regulator [bacterium]|nr:PadR family transcriptional regulator [bacterium]